MKVFVFDTSICNGCYNCQIACKDEHCGNDWTPYAKPQPETGQFWLKLSEYVRGTVPKVKVHYVATLCNHCDDPACLDACPVDGAIYKRDDGLVIIDPEKCTGCTNCVSACPYEAIYMNDELNIAQKCTGCAHLLDAGWKEPRCVDACPTGALKFLEEADAADLVADAELLASRQRPGAAGLLPEPAQEVHRRHGVRPGQEGGRQAGHVRAHARRRRRGHPGGDRRVRGLLVPRTRRRHLLPGDPCGGFPGEAVRRAEHGERHQPRRHPPGLGGHASLLSPPLSPSFGSPGS